MEIKKGLSRKAIYLAIVLVVVVIGAIASFVFLSNRGKPSNNLKITQYGREFNYKQDIGGGDYMWIWTVSIKIVNLGDNNVNGAELVVELKADHATIDSASESFILQAGWETTEHVIIQARQSEWLNKNCQVVATIYLGSEVLDQYTTSW